VPIFRAMSELVRMEQSGGVALLTLNRPDLLNSFNRPMGRALVAGIEAAAGDSAVRAVLLTGAGRGFCAGQDLAEAAPATPDGPMPDLGDIVRDTYNPIVRAIRGIEKPVVCAVNGVAAGAGASIALACDLVYASSAASFVWSFAKIGVIPDSGGTFLLPRMLGLPRASALAMLGEKISAQQAYEWGLVWKVCDPEALVAAAMETASYLATQPTRALGLTKRGFNRSLGVDLSDQLDYEEEIQREAGQTADYAEGVRAFLAKRKPAYRGE
jgi:2-(1,2-epoxy-1,2-dihydrophenyl)acetyl-CoA isomerase